jgi:hypothetical protein
LDRDVNVDDPTIPQQLPPKSASVSLNHWREAMAHLRHLDNEVWVGLRTFLTANSFLFVAIAGLLAFGVPGARAQWLVVVLSATGIALTLVARYILRRHRNYYLQMLLRKSLLEWELGFYDTKLCGSNTDLAFPWRLTPEVVQELKRDPEPWIQRSIRGPGTIARLQFWIYEGLMGLYVAAVILALAGILASK